MTFDFTKWAIGRVVQRRGHKRPEILIQRCTMCGKNGAAVPVGHEFVKYVHSQVYDKAVDVCDPRPGAKR